MTFRDRSHWARAREDARRRRAWVKDGSPPCGYCEDRMGDHVIADVSACLRCYTDCAHQRGRFAGTQGRG